MRIAVFGAGGVGGYFGGRLAQAGHSVAFVARGPHLDALRRDGLAVESVAGDFAVRPVEAAGDPREVGPVDAVLVCVKAWQVREAASAVGPLLGPSTFAVPLQNGVEAADELAEAIGPVRVVPGLCRILSYVSAPGWIRHAGVVPRVEFGERDGRATTRVAALRSAFQAAHGVSVAVPGDITAALWDKFLFIAPVSAVGAVTRAAAGELRTVPETRALLEQAVRETWTVGRARGVALREDAVARTLAFVDGLPAQGTASMQRDIMEGRPSELEYQIGAVVRLAAQVGVPVPASTFLYASLLPAERRARAGAGEPAPTPGG
ncbi:MAG TPA: 2-dehydropantoate 2-reductase [Vicinamibacteria bacterium]|nr:2-dehydropantoate 2-reductase [Vicinamibacteria bacterium]